MKSAVGGKLFEDTETWLDTLVQRPEASAKPIVAEVILRDRECCRRMRVLKPRVSKKSSSAIVAILAASFSDVASQIFLVAEQFCEASLWCVRGVLTPHQRVANEGRHSRSGALFFFGRKQDASSHCFPQTVAGLSYAQRTKSSFASGNSGCQGFSDVPMAALCGPTPVLHRHAYTPPTSYRQRMSPC